MSDEKITLSEVKKIALGDNIIIGTDETIRGLKKGTIAQVLLSSNCDEITRSDLVRYAELAGAEVHELDIDNEELGVACKKPFSISVLSVLKGAQ